MAHTHQCKVCKVPVAICDDVGCHQGKHPETGDLIPVDTHDYCSLHHPDEANRVEDKPVVRMTVKVAD